MNTDIKNHYETLWAKHGDTVETAQYSSRESQEARFAILSEVADLNGLRVLDFGCGTAHLATYLKRKEVQCHYTGVDVVDAFFPAARAKHPEHQFDRWEELGNQRFDYALVSGVFNNKMDDNLGFFKTWVTRLWERCDQGLAFNLMSTYVSYQQNDLWYVNPEDVFCFMKTLTPFISIRNEYVVKDVNVPFEFAVYAYKNPLKAWS